MLLSLSHRKDGVDLMKSDGILPVAATIFDDASVRRKTNTGVRYMVLAAVVAC